MQLCYRGVPYQKNPTAIPSTESATIGNYRGKPCHKSILKNALSLEGIRQLKYRSISYISPVWGWKSTLSPLNSKPKQGVQSRASSR